MKLLPKMKLTRAKVVLLLCIAILSISWWIGDLRKPVELNFCGESINFGTPQYKCLRPKTLKVPRAYYGDFNQFDFTTPIAGEPNFLIVAYPSMMPWYDVPLWERWNTHQLVIELGLLTVPDVRGDLAAYFLGTPKPSRMPGLFYGLEQYVSEPAQYFQYSIPFEPSPRVFIRCAFSNELNSERIQGCQTTSYTSWGLLMQTHHKRMLTPLWVDIHDKVQELVQSFVVTP